MPARSEARTEFLADVIIGFAEDFGYNSWRQIVSYKHTPSDEAFATLVDVEEDDKEYTATLDVVAKGISAILNPEFKINDSLRAAIKEADEENDAGMIDAEGADVIVQAGLFSEIVYG